MLALHGHDVEREFYVNDAGSQVRKLGESIAALARGETVPEDGYKGDYVAELAAQLAGRGERRPGRARPRGGGVRDRAASQARSRRSA